MTLACLPFLLQLLGTVARKNSSSQSAAIGAAHEMNLRQITDGTYGPLALNKAKGPDRPRLPLPENGNFMTVRNFRGRYWGTVMKILIFVKVRQNPPWKYIFVEVFHTPSRKCTNFVKVCHIPSRECTIFMMLSCRLSRK